MINLKPDVVLALKNDAELVSLLGGPRIYFQVAPNPDEFPRVTYYEQDNRPSLWGDNRELGSEITFVVDIWAKASTTAIADAVDRVMASLGFVREFAGDLYEQDTQVYHKAMRYRILR